MHDIDEVPIILFYFFLLKNTKNMGFNIRVGEKINTMNTTFYFNFVSYQEFKQHECSKMET